MIKTQEMPGTIVRELTIEAPADKVFVALTDPNEVVQWWGDSASYRCTDMTSDLRVGGKWRTQGVGCNGEAFAVEGTYRAIERPRLLEYTWRHAFGGAEDFTETIVRFDLEERDAVTHLRLTHSGFTSEASQADHAQGWLRVLEWLHAYMR